MLLLAFQNKKAEASVHLQVASVKLDEMKVKQEDVSKVLTEVRTMKGRQEGMNGKLDSLKR